jgi:transcriptional regulator with XRE-family HTH domain
MVFGRWIAARRRHLGLSQRELAAQLCAAIGRQTMTRNELSRYERGVRIPGPGLVAAVAVCLRLPIAALRFEIAKLRRRRAGAADTYDSWGGCAVAGGTVEASRAVVAGMASAEQVLRDMYRSCATTNSAPCPR